MTVGTIVGLVASGKTVDQVLADYPYLEREDILEALAYAAWRAEERESLWPCHENRGRYEFATSLGPVVCRCRLGGTSLVPDRYAHCQRLWPGPERTAI